MDTNSICGFHLWNPDLVFVFSFNNQIKKHNDLMKIAFASQQPLQLNLNGRPNDWNCYLVINMSARQNNSLCRKFEKSN